MLWCCLRAIRTKEMMHLRSNATCIISLVGVGPQVWWKEQEADQLLGDMSSQDVAEALAEAGIEVGPKARQQHRNGKAGLSCARTAPFSFFFEVTQGVSLCS